MRAALASALAITATFFISSHAWAFCRATTCDPSKAQCLRDNEQCLTTGEPLFWASSCVQVYVQADGSPRQGISFDMAKQSVSRAFGAWLSADCGRAAPLLDVQVLGPITCGTAEYNPTQRNANIVVFRNDEWPYIGAEDALGLTTVHFDSDTGELWDADIELNAIAGQFSVGDPVTGDDLDSILTHEAGHLLGLAHTLAQDATMFASYTAGTDTLRTLASDDVSAVCDVYAPDRVPSRTSCSPRHGFSDACGADQPANSGTNAGTDQEVAANSGGIDMSKGCVFAPTFATPSWPSSIAMFASALCLLRRRRGQPRLPSVSCERVARGR
jgi:hypothetical protein